jgi:hypothetical protein
MYIYIDALLGCLLPFMEIHKKIDVTVTWGFVAEETRMRDTERVSSSRRGL